MSLTHVNYFRDNFPPTLIGKFSVLGYVPWDHVSHEHNSLLNPGFPILGEHLGCVLLTFQQAT